MNLEINQEIIQTITSTNKTILQTTKCRLIHELKNYQINDHQIIQLYHYYLHEENEIIMNELIDFFLKTSSFQLYVTLKQAIEMKIESDKTLFLLLQLICKDFVYLFLESQLFCLNDIILSIARHSKNDVIISLAIQLFDILLSYAINDFNNTNEFNNDNRINFNDNSKETSIITSLTSNETNVNNNNNDIIKQNQIIQIDLISFHSLLESCYLMILDTFNKNYYHLFNQLLQYQYFQHQLDMIQILQYFNMIHLIQSTILSPELSSECLQCIELIMKTLSSEVLLQLFSTVPLCDFLIECIFQQPENSLMINIIEYLPLTYSLSKKLLSLIKPSYNAFRMIIKIKQYVPLIECHSYFQQIIQSITNEKLSDEFVDLFIEMNKIKEIDVLIVINQLIRYCEQCTDVDKLYQLFELLLQPQYQLMFVMNDGIHLLLQYGMKEQLHLLLTSAFTNQFNDLYHLNYSFSLNEIPSSLEELVSSIDSTVSITLLWLSLYSTPLISSDIIFTIQPSDSIGLILLLSIYLHLHLPLNNLYSIVLNKTMNVDVTEENENINNNNMICDDNNLSNKNECNQILPLNILFGDVPFTGMLSYPLLSFLLSPEYETLLIKHSSLITQSIQFLLEDPHFVIISFEEKQSFDNKIDWFSLLLLN